MDYRGDEAPFSVIIAYRHRYPLPFLVDPQDNELPGLYSGRYQGGIDFQEVVTGGERLIV